MYMTIAFFSTPSYELMPIMYVCIMYYVAPNWNIWYTKDEYLFFKKNIKIIEKISS